VVRACLLMGIVATNRQKSSMNLETESNRLRQAAASFPVSPL
jgi:hypothetical protein